MQKMLIILALMVLFTHTAQRLQSIPLFVGSPPLKRTPPLGAVALGLLCHKFLNFALIPC